MLNVSSICQSVLYLFYCKFSGKGGKNKSFYEKICAFSLWEQKNVRIFVSE